MSEQTFTVSSVVAAGPEAVWERVASPEGINHELGPWLRMTVPTTASGGGASLDSETVPIGATSGW